VAPVIVRCASARTRPRHLSMKFGLVGCTCTLPSKVRLQDIADRVGVSIATVSHALNGRYDQVSQETAREIIAVARELGYTGTALRRPFNTATPTVAVITS